MPPIGATFEETASGSSCVLRELATLALINVFHCHLLLEFCFLRPTKFRRYKPVDPSAPPDDPVADYMNILGMIFSMCGLMMRLKWCAWVALYCSFVSFSNSKITDDAKQIVSSFMLSISSVVMCYLQNPTPINYAL
ncbi:Protein Asterix [Trichinella spiralis]|uniref:Protein Asterix n=1 Tax=Trichinella spiralis TaxID=6334 RepID=A0ABR3KFZ8_TRISP